MPTPRYRLAVVGSQNGIFYYAIGGQDYGGVDANERYNACSGEWETLAPMPTPRANTGAALIDGNIYVPGGWADNQYFNVLEIYDPTTDSWHVGASMPYAISGPAVAAHGGKLYTFGGNLGGGHTDKTLAYDPTTDTWSEKAPLPGGMRAFATAVEMDGKIYVVGGWPNLNTVEVYDPASDSWATVSSMNVGRQSPGLTAAPDGYLYVAGGGSGWSGLSSSERYDPSTDTWALLPALNNSDRAGTASTYVAGRVFAVGGTGSSSSDGNESLKIGNDFCFSHKSAWQSVVKPGDRITYTIEIHPDQVDRPNASLIDPMPTGTTFAGFGANSAGASYDSANDRIVWNGSVPANAKLITFTFGVDLLSEGWQSGDEIVNIVTFDNGDGLIHTSTATSRLFFPDPSPSVKEVDQLSARSGDVLNYTIHVKNASSINDTFSLHDPIPPHTTYVPGSLQYDTDIGIAHYDSGQKAIVWTGALPELTYMNASNDYTWGDSDGSGIVPDVTFDWIDTTGGKVAIGSYKDYGISGPFELGFTFDYYGLEYTQFYVNPDGVIQFDNLGSWYDACPFDPYTPNNGIHVLGRDTVIDGDPGKVYYQTLGSEPNRHTVIEFHQLRNYSGSAYSDLQVILYETGNIKLQYKSIATQTGTGSGGGYPDDMTHATVGIEDKTGSRSLQYGSECPATVHDELAVLFVPPGGSIGDFGTDITFSVSTAASLPINTWITNTATVSSSYSSIQCSASTVINAVDLSQSWKRADKTLASAGEPVTYDFLLRNDGFWPATGATLTDSIPTDMDYVSGSVTCSAGSCTYDSGVVTWNGDIAPGSTVTLTFAAALNTLLPSRTIVTNTAQLNDGYGNTYDLQDTFLVSSPNLQSSFKKVTPSVSNPGETATYAIYVYNSGDGDTTGEVRDVLPPELTYEADSLSCGTGDCVYASGVISWTGIVPAHSIVPVRFRTKVSPVVERGTWITNTATVSNAYDTVMCSAKLLITPVDLSESWKQSDKSQAVLGDVITYDLYLENTGVSTASASLSDPIPDSLTYVPGSATCSSGVCTYQDGTLTWAGEIAPGDTIMLTIAATLSTPLPDQTVVTNTAYLDDGYGNIHNLAAGFEVQSANLSTSWKHVDKSQAIKGEVLTYDFLLENTGLVTATGATLIDPLPDSLTYVPGSLVCSAGSCDHNSGQISWSGDIAPGDTVTLTLAVTLTASLPDRTVLVNIAYLDDGIAQEYTIGAGFLVRSSDLSASYIRVAPEEVALGQVVTYTATISNAGMVATVGQMQNVLPEGLTFIPGSLDCDSGTCDHIDGVITWEGDVAPQDTVVVHFQATVTSGNGPNTPFVNSVVITDKVLQIDYVREIGVMVSGWNTVYIPWIAQDFATDSPTQDNPGNFGPEVDGAFGDGNGVLALGDVDGDGDLDAVVASEIWLNDGQGNFPSLHDTFDSGDSRDLALGDMDGDGDLDAVVANYLADNHVWLNDGNGDLGDEAHDAFGGSNTSDGVVLGDVDGDGDLDAVVSNYAQPVEVWQNDGNGNLGPLPYDAFDGSTCGNRVSLGDVDEDGDLDAVIVSTCGIPHRVQLNDGSGHFGPTAHDTFGSAFASSVDMGDVNDDGHLDIIVASHTHTTQEIWLGDGSGHFGPNPHDTFGTSNSTSVFLGDIDGDDDLDAVIGKGNYDTEPQEVWLNNGDGQFGTVAYCTFAPDADHVLALDDLDNDGDLDVITKHEQTKGVWLN
jgi:uncharacterized repeat protein (TIGR01451 family)